MGKAAPLCFPDGDIVSARNHRAVSFTPVSNGVTSDRKARANFVAFT